MLKHPLDREGTSNLGPPCLLYNATELAPKILCVTVYIEARCPCVLKE